MKKTEGIDYGYINIEQINPDGEKHTSTLVWHKGYNDVEVLGNIPHRNRIVITDELIIKLSSVIGRTIDMW